MPVTQGRVSYAVGNKNSPGDPWGRSTLVLEPDGQARLDQDTMGGMFSFTGTVAAAALEKFWKALEGVEFPGLPQISAPAGSATRSLTIGKDTAYLAYHAALSMPGYGTAFHILDTIVRQISLDMVKVGPPSQKIVDGAQRVSDSK